jgi:hypothetical protein
MLSRTLRIMMAGLVAAALGACATTPPPQPDLTPPKPARADAKTTLESGRSYR